MPLIPVFIPGYRNSGEGHWHRLWHQRLKSGVWVEQRDWEYPQLNDWVQTLELTLAPLRGEIMLVAHSLGCLTLAHWAARGNT